MTAPAAEGQSDTAPDPEPASGEPTSEVKPRSRSLTERAGIHPTQPARPRPAGQAGSGARATGSGRQAAGTGGRTAKATPGFLVSQLKFSGQSGAHRLVIAEFLLCVVLIGLTPIMVRPPAADGQGKPHLYQANDFLRLTSVCLLFFILALLSNQPRSARFAAAFGALVTLGTIYNARQALVAVANLFGGQYHIPSPAVGQTLPITEGGVPVGTVTNTGGGGWIVGSGSDF